MEMTTTERGFDYSQFTDEHGYKCSLQKSSMATKQCIWLGVDELDPKVLVPNQGWRTFDIPSDVMFYNRMHLTQEMVKELLPALIKFAETGELT